MLVILYTQHEVIRLNKSMSCKCDAAVGFLHFLFTGTVVLEVTVPRFVRR